MGWTVDIDDDDDEGGSGVDLEKRKVGAVDNFYEEFFKLAFFYKNNRKYCYGFTWMRMILITSDICTSMRLLQELINKLVSFQTFSKIHKLVPECSL